MRIMCGGPTQRFSGRAERRPGKISGCKHRNMGTETKPGRARATIRDLHVDDVQAVTAISRVTPEAANWTEESYRSALTWTGVVAFVSDFDSKVTGFILARQLGEEAEILNLAVSPARPKKGAGRALLKAAMDEFRARQVGRVFLEVRESNKAGISFYSKHGFSKRDIRFNYYREPDEAAVVMEIKLREDRKSVVWERV